MILREVRSFLILFQIVLRHGYADGVRGNSKRLNQQSPCAGF
nr:MAG TPA: hypothetical protein [Caudoviricetes sp.]